MHIIATPAPQRLVVKYGGNASSEPAIAALAAELAELGAAGHAVILVHGGGPEIDEALAANGIATERLEGLRVTDASTLRIAEAVLCATANKRLVRACLRAGVPAVGLCGQDGGLLRVRAAHTESGRSLGYVGEVLRVDVAPLHALLQGGFVPIIAPLGIDESAEHAYNVNADTAAGAIAAALRVDAYVALTNVQRVLADPHDPASAMNVLSLADAQRFARSQACSGGMRPKIQAAVQAVLGGAGRAYICAAGAGAIARALLGDATIVQAGTT